MFKKYYLVADIGATNTRIAIIDDNHTILHKQAFLSIKPFEELLKEFLSGNRASQYNLNAACFAVAGIIDSERKNAQMSNNPNRLDKEVLGKTVKTKILLINDFEATGFSVNSLRLNQYTELTQSGQTDGTVAVLGAGTGLGMSILRPYNNIFIPYASEGGHTSLPASYDKMDNELYAYLKKHGAVLEKETILSGRGIVLLYDFLLSKKIKHNSKIAREIKKAYKEEKAPLITKYALEDKDVLCIRTMDTFVRFYAHASRDLALTSLCTKLIISGGIAPRILPFFKESFIEYFSMHEREFARKLLESISVSVITDPDINLHGCLNALKILKFG